jgi:hypothetical protein
VVYASATRAGSRVFQASSASRAFSAAVSAENGGSGGRVVIGILDIGILDRSPPIMRSVALPTRWPL